VTALEAPEQDASGDQERARRTAVLRRLSNGDIEFDEAMRLLEQ